ncbi:MAG: NAD(P)/FAD-dependent oxidoreductase, partial [Candidatus Hodarchaeales archaeon]
AGTEIRTGTKVNGLTIDPDKGAELTTKNISSQVETIHSKLVIACDGPVSRIAASQGIKTPVKYVHGAEWKVKGKLSESLDIYFDHELTPHGYSWVFPKNETSTIGVVCRQVYEPAKRLEQLMKIMEKRLGQNFERIKLIGGLIPASSSLPDETYRSRLLLAGDAGGFTNPLFYGGISNAILTGRLAGETVVQSVNEDPDQRFTKKSLALYEKKWQEEPTFNPEIYEGREIFYKQFTNVELEQMGKFANNTNLGRVGWFKTKYLSIKAGFTKPIRKRRHDYNKVVRAFQLSGQWGF